MSADKIKGPIVIFTKAKKNSHAPQGLELLDLSWELPTGFSKRRQQGTGNESTAGQPNDDSNVSARQRQGN